MAIIKSVHFTLKDSSIVTIRSLRVGDEETLRMFAILAAKESKNTLKYEGMPLMPIEKFTSQFSEFGEHPVNIHIGAFFEGQIIANLRFFQRNSTHPWIKHIGAFGMAVREAYWGHGVGSRLLQIMDSHARSTEIKRIEAEVRASNDRGIYLYEKNGFKIEGRREKAAFIDDTYEDEFYIAKCF